MKINVKKCAVLRCTRSRSVSSIQHNYTLSAHEIAIKECHVYLCVEIDLKWSSHIQTISLPVFYFMKRNLYNCSADIKRTAYLGQLWSMLPQSGILIIMLIYRKVQFNGYNILFYYCFTVTSTVLYRASSITALLSTLEIPTLEQRCQSSRLTLVYKIINNLLPISVPSYYHHTQFHTRQHHRDHFILPQATLSCHLYKYSFYPRTIKD